MKKIFFALAFSSLLIACKKENSNPNSPVTKTPTTVEDTTKKTADSVTCIDNPKINFSSIGTPIGKLSYCIKDIDGNVYKTVIIGKQQWMAENLKVSRYNDGTVIPNVKDSLDWIKLSKGAWCYMKNDSSYNELYGKLYNWYVVGQKTIDNKNVCPIGWHVPTSTEWNELIEYLGGQMVAGGKIREIGLVHWLEPFLKDTKSTNTSLFTALPSGRSSVVDNIRFDGISKYAVWWTSSEKNKDFSSYIGLDYFIDILSPEENRKQTGNSIRCIKD
jgi:uncharacterized protein (TIGR02145 family)